jgi:hypothetical protein
MATSFDSSAQTFYVEGFNTIIDASLAIIYDGSINQLFNADVDASFSVPLNVIKNLIRYSSDAYDINDSVGEDIRYKVCYDASNSQYSEDVSNNTVLGTNFTNVLCYQSTCSPQDYVFHNNTAGAYDRTVAADFIRFIAYRLFNTAMGVDLFVNESTVKNNLNTTAVHAFFNVLKSLDELRDSSNNAYLDASFCVNILGSNVLINAGQPLYDASGNPYNISNYNFIHPAYSIIKQMIAKTPERFYDMSANKISGTETDLSDNSVESNPPIYMAPFRSGDKLYFMLAIKAASGQGSVVATTSGPAINLTTAATNVPGTGYVLIQNTRYYKILINIH